MELIQWWRNYFKNAPSHPTKAVNGGPLLDNVLRRQGRQHRENPDAGLARARRRAVHRHRLPGGDEGPGLRLGQLRHLSRAVARAERRVGDDVARQARPDHHAQVPRARPAVPGRGDRRHASGAGHAGRHRDSLRQERAGGRRRHPRRADRGHQHAEDRPAGAGELRRSPSRASSIPTTRSRKGRSANGPAITPAAAISSPRSASTR